jgi:pimeloyl-ACP methyl ester carboxylesterase
MPQRPTLFLLHALGGSARAWSGVIDLLKDEFDAVAIDLPGFGDASPSTGLTVSDMADHVCDVVRRKGARRWLIAGHSMGGKIATVVASRALAGGPGLFGLAGVALFAASPPSPEPMDEERRQRMIDWAAHGTLDDAAAREFVDGNVGAPLLPEQDAIAIADLERASREAWLAWLERGSREDWSAAIGRLDVPALLMAGGDDEDLGEDGQRATNAKVYPRARLQVEAGAGHLLPLERTDAVAESLRRFWQDVAGLGPVVPPAFAAMIDGDRVSRRTRGILAVRALADDPSYEPRSLNAAQLSTLRSVGHRTVPQDGPPIDLAARIDQQLALGKGDGWRFSTLPPDEAAYAQALDALAGFDALPTEQQDAMLADIAAGRFTPPAGALLTAEQMKQWFEDARTDLARLWLAHPATMARIGFDGFANGGDGVRKQGFERLGADEREAWEPMLMEVSR